MQNFRSLGALDGPLIHQNYIVKLISNLCISMKYKQKQPLVIFISAQSSGVLLAHVDSDGSHGISACQ